MDSCKLPRWQLLKDRLNNLDIDAFCLGYKNNVNAICLDVRTYSEFKTGYLPGAINLDYLSHQLADHLEELDKSKHYYIYCRTGRRSIRVGILLKNMGFQHIYNLEEGIKKYGSSILVYPREQVT